MSYRAKASYVAEPVKGLTLYADLNRQPVRVEGVSFTPESEIILQTGGIPAQLLTRPPFSVSVWRKRPKLHDAVLGLTITAIGGSRMPDSFVAGVEFRRLTLYAGHFILCLSIPVAYFKDAEPMYICNFQPTLHPHTERLLTHPVLVLEVIQQANNA